MATPKEDSAYFLTFRIGSGVYKAAGASVLEALSSLKPKQFGKGFATLEVLHNGKTSKLPIKIFPTKLERIFSKQWELQLFAKRVATLI